MGRSKRKQKAKVMTRFSKKQKQLIVGRRIWVDDSQVRAIFSEKVVQVRPLQGIFPFEAAPIDITDLDKWKPVTDDVPFDIKDCPLSPTDDSYRAWKLRQLKKERQEARKKREDEDAWSRPWNASDYD